MVFTHFSPEWNKKNTFCSFVHNLAVELSYFICFWQFGVTICPVLFVINMIYLKGFCQFVSILCNLFVWLLITCVNFFVLTVKDIQKCKTQPTQIFKNVFSLIPVHTTKFQLLLFCALFFQTVDVQFFYFFFCSTCFVCFTLDNGAQH